MMRVVRVLAASAIVLVCTASSGAQTASSSRPDPRIGLAAGLRDAGVAASGMELVANVPKPQGFFDPRYPAGEPNPPVTGDDDKAASTTSAAKAPKKSKSAAKASKPKGPAWGGLNFANSDLAFSGNHLFVGNFSGFTPYVGAGIGGAHIKWDDLKNDNGVITIHKGAKNWRFAYALMAGASYCLTDQLKLDAGYRFSHINGGKMFEYNNGGGPGYDRGFNTHEVRAGLRYQFGKSDCAPPEPIAYEPPPEPIYTK